MDGRPPPDAYHRPPSGWYTPSSHFPYHPHPPPPPPPPPPPYPAAAPHPYHHYPSPHYPAQHPYPPPPPPDQGWNGYNSAIHQEPNVHLGDVEDLAARARAWAAARAAMDHQKNLHSSHLGVPVGEVKEEQYNYFHQEQFHQQHNQPSRPNYFNGTPSHVSQLPQSNTVSTRPSSHYDSNGQCPLYTDGNGGAFQGSADSGPFISPSPHSVAPPNYQQEVPSSYSSYPGADGVLRQYEQMATSKELPIETHRFLLHSAMSSSGSITMDNSPSYAIRDVSIGSFTDAEPVNSKLYKVNCSRPENGVEDHLVTWTSASASLAVEPAYAPPSSLAAAVFERMPVRPSGFHTSIPAITTGSTSAVTAASNIMHPATLLHGDANGGLVNVTERPKKSAVPGWLREEILKKSNIASSVQDHNYERRRLPSTILEDEDADCSLKDDLSDNRSNVSSGGSVVNEDDNEDEDADIARIAAMNQQIKRILTEVLLKVTDELFDEIATKVINEPADQGLEDTMIENEADGSHIVSASLPPLPSDIACVEDVRLIPGKISINGGEVQAKGHIALLSSRSGGDLLGLANYASDEENNEIQDAAESRLPEIELDQLENGSQVNHYADLEEDNAEVVNNGATENHIRAFSGTSDVQDSKVNMENAEAGGERKVFDRLEPVNVHDVCQNSQIVDEGSVSTNKEKRNKRNDVEGKNVASFVHSIKSEERDKRDSRKKKGVSTKEEIDNSKECGYEKHTRSQEGQEVKIDVSKLERSGRPLGPKDERIKDRGLKHVERITGANLAQTDHRNSRNDRKRGAQEEARNTESNREEVGYRRKELRDEDKQDVPIRHQGATDMDRTHKRPRSPSFDRGSRRSGDRLNSGESDLRGEVRARSRERKMQFNRRPSLSPLASRSRKIRKDSRSPHSKQSQRMQSPFSSHDSRRRRSRSGTPVRKRR